MENLKDKVELETEIDLESETDDLNSTSTLNIEDSQNLTEDNSETPIESVDLNPNDANTTNCLALTIQDDHKLIAVKNVFLRSIRMSWKVVVSAITLALIKLFS